MGMLDNWTIINDWFNDWLVLILSKPQHQTRQTREHGSVKVSGNLDAL